MAMSLVTLPMAIAMVFSVFPVQSAEILLRSLGKQAEENKGALVVGGLRGRLEEEGYGLSDGDGAFHDDGDQDEKPKEDKEEADEDAKDVKGSKKDADDDEKSKSKEGKKKNSDDAKDEKKHDKEGAGDDGKQKEEDEGDDKEDEEDDNDDKVEELEKQLSLARIEKKEHEAEQKSFGDDSAFAKKLAADVESIGNETQSYALARFLGNLKASQRQFAKANYAEFMEEEIEKVDKKIKKLEKALDEAEDNSDEKAKTDKKAKPEAGKAEKKAAKKAAKDIGLPTHQSAGQTFAVAFFANVAMLAVVFAMANAQTKSVQNYTWFLIDQVVAIFLAVMHFQAFDSLLSFSSMGVSSAVISSIVHTVVLLVVVLVAAYYLRKKKVALAVLCGAGAHFVGFSSIHSSTSLQNKVFVAASYTTLAMVAGLCVLALGLGMIVYLAHTAKKRAEDPNDRSFDGYEDKTDDLENDVCATAFSVVFTMLVRFLLTGHHPDDDETEFDHTAGQRLRMLIYAFVCLILAAFGIVFISEKAAGASYATKRVCNFFTTVLAMNVAWAFLYWGEWEFFEALYPGDPTKGRVMFAVVVTLLGGLLLMGLAAVPDTVGVEARVKTLALTALGLVIAFSWELTFDSAVEQMVEGRSHPVVIKVASCVAMLAIILPVYALYMKPITMKAQEALEGDAPPPKVEKKEEVEGHA